MSSINFGVELCAGSAKFDSDERETYLRYRLMNSDGIVLNDSRS